MSQKEIVEALRAARIAAGLTQAQVGQQLGIRAEHAARMVCRWESGAVPALPRLIEWAEALGVTLAVVPR